MYIIDFDRINELCAPHPADEKSTYGLTSVYSISKMFIKKYLTIFEHRNSKRKEFTDDEIQEADTLIYNRILLTRSELRDKKIDKVLE